MTIPTPLQQVDRTFVRHKGRKLAYFAGCDYFRLASHPQVLHAAALALKRYGLNVSASRLTTGNHLLYGQLEASLAEFFDVESATLASSGYAPNLMAAQALQGQFTHVLLDERAHGCLVDAAQLMDCPVLKFKHRDAEDLARLLQRLGKIKPLLLTDGMFSHDGTIAPVKKYLAALPAEAWILLDDAHGAGLLGDDGRGTPQQARVSSHRIIQTITLSKAFGVYGGAVLGPASLKKAIVERSRLFVGNTPLPLPLANAALKAVQLLKTHPRWRTKLRENIAFVKKQISAGALSADAGQTPIIPILPKSGREAESLKKRLLARGIFPSFIKYPGGPENGYFRLVISSEHTRKQLEDLVAALQGK